MANEFPEDRPIFLQISEMLEDGIASGAYAEGAPVPSTTDLAVAYTINPATARKGMAILVDRGLIYKRRGVGMFVAKGARELILGERRQAFEEARVAPVARAARELGIPKAELAEMIERAYENVD